MTLPPEIESSHDEQNGKSQDGEERKRVAWDNHLQFILAMMSFCIGLGNLWRFPYLIQKWGGGNFVMLFVVFMVVMGVPLILLEFMLGQRYQKGVIQCWLDMHPSLLGIGFAAAIAGFLIASYYIVINAWGIYYFFNSLSSFGAGVLPWASCPINGTSFTPEVECLQSSPTEYFFYRNAMGITESIEETGSSQTCLLLVFIMAWAMIFLFMRNGIESSGKVMYFTATFPFLVLLIFLIRGLTLEGSSNGLQYLLKIDGSKLLDIDLWLDAASQVFYSIGIGGGGVIAFASYCPQDQNVMRDSITIGILNVVTALYIAATIFSIMGFRATFQYNECLAENIDTISDFYNLALDTITTENYDDLVYYGGLPEIDTQIYDASVIPQDQFGNVNNCSLEEFLNNGVGGSGLAFIVITDGINQMPAPVLMSCLFFFMLLLLGIGSMFGAVEAFVTPMVDFCHKSGWNFSKPVIASFGCVACALVGLIFTFQSGYYWVNVFNDYSVGVPLVLIGTVELIICCWCFGLERWMDNLDYMLGPPNNKIDKILKKFYRIMLGYVSPVILVIIVAFSIANMFTGSYMYQTWDAALGQEIQQKYPTWCIIFIICLQLLSILQIPFWMLVFLCGKEKMLSLVTDGEKPLLDFTQAWNNFTDVLFCRSAGKTTANTEVKNPSFVINDELE